MAEFKRLSDVEVVAEPAESANVLIEEDGVIKKAPKTVVGGSGGATTGVVVIDIYAYYDSEDNDYYLDYTELSISDKDIEKILSDDRNSLNYILNMQFSGNGYAEYVVNPYCIQYEYNEEDDYWCVYMYARVYSNIMEKIVDIKIAWNVGAEDCSIKGYHKELLV